jgi:hypothetical protein
MISIFGREVGEYPEIEEIPTGERRRGSHMDEGRIISYAGEKREGITIWKKGG